jgi:hypothetical protein
MDEIDPSIGLETKPDPKILQRRLRSQPSGRIAQQVLQICLSFFRNVPHRKCKKTQKFIVWTGDTAS